MIDENRWVAPQARLFLLGAPLVLVGLIAAHTVWLKAVCLIAGGLLVGAFFVAYLWRAARFGIPEHDKTSDDHHWTGSGPLGP